MAVVIAGGLNPKPQTLNPSRPLYRLLPFHDDVESIRYTIGVQFVGIVCGALALAAVVKTIWGALCQLRSLFVARH